MIYHQHLAVCQWQTHEFLHLGENESLSSYVHDILQDEKGYIYFGTSQGLAKYNGNQIKTFRHNPSDPRSIGPGEIWSLCTTNDGKLYLGMRLGGLYSFDPKTNYFTALETYNPTRAGIQTITCLLPDSEGIWIGRQTHYFEFFNFKTKSITRFQLKNPPLSVEQGGYRIEEIMQDRLDTNLLWLCFIDYQSKTPNSILDARLVQFNKRTKTFTFTNCLGEPKIQSHDSSIWGVAQGVYNYNTNSNQCIQYPIYYEQFIPGEAVFVTDIVSYKDHFLISSPNVISRFFKDGRYEPFLIGKEFDEFTNIFKDDQQNIWFSRSNGVSMLANKEKPIRFTSLSNTGIVGKLYPSKLAISDKYNKLFCVDNSFDGTHKKMFSIDLESGDIKPFWQSSSQIYGLCYDRYNKLWVLNADGLHTIENLIPNTLTTIKTNINIPWVWNLVYTHQHNIIANNASDIFWFDPYTKPIFVHRKTLTKAKHMHDYAALHGCFLNTEKEIITFSNIIYAIHLTGSVKQLNIQKNALIYPESEILSVIQDSCGYYWISNFATTARFKRINDSLLLIKRYSVDDNVNITSATEMSCDAKGRIWLFTSNGICVINPYSNEVMNFGLADGLGSAFLDPRQIMYSSKNTVYCNNSNGIISFHPDSLWNSNSEIQIPIAIEAILVNSKPIIDSTNPNYIDTIQLAPHHTSLDVHFQALHFSPSMNITYRYKILELQHGWIALGSNSQLSLSNLSAGSYTLMIKADKSGTEAKHQHVKTIYIVKSNYFYETNWFKTILFLIGTSLIYFVYYYVEKTKRKKAIEKIEQHKQLVELELRALRSQMNPHFMFNSLNSIKSFILKSDPASASEYLSNFAHLIRLILQHSRESEISLKDEIETLSLYIDLEKLRINIPFDYSIDVDPEVDPSNTYLPPMLIQPFVENALWHGLSNKPVKGNLHVHFSILEQQLICVVTDDGIGRHESSILKSKQKIKYKSVGTNIIQDRIQLMNTIQDLGITVEINDNNPSDAQYVGTKVIIRFPYKDQNQLS